MDSVVVSRSAGVAEIAMDDGKANAFGPAMTARFDAALDEALADEATGAVLIAGRDGIFSGGLDLKVLPTLEPRALREALARFTRLMERLHTFPRPIVAAVTGHALAGGALLALCADVRLGAQGAFRFGINEVALGIAMPAFGVEIARAAVAPPVLTEVLVHGRVFSPAEAHARGVFESLHEPSALRAAARARAAELAKLPSAAYALTKARLLGTPGAVGNADEELAGFVAAIQRVGTLKKK